MPQLKLLFLVALGGAIGSTARYAISLLWLQQRNEHDSPLPWPWATFLANLSGALLIGIAAALLTQQPHSNSSLKALILTGILGGFTTFSSYSLETLQLIKQNQLGLAASYSLSSLILGLAAAALGLTLTKALLSS